ncbi:MaoC family dehydratase N-terminal domain-containing protein [Fictibacillus sp. Mic-4]|uniref:MaoC family dehydratase N-terminal domain-containing protein n=1 Tax=Fictibacillus TaxID=1329200 RepID=UPI000411DDAB|nr:MaoC family dehydratase N-terminal domain-containing protein [Fictibacillus gelatini]
MLQEFVGKRSNKVKNIVERGAVKKFAEAIGDASPIFIDEEAGRRSRYKTNIAPPTFPRVFDYGEIDGMNLPDKGLIHGEQTFHFKRPLLVGEEVYCYVEVSNYSERKGTNGVTGFLVLKRYGEDSDGKLIFSERQIVIITEAARRG